MRVHTTIGEGMDDRNDATNEVTIRWYGACAMIGFRPSVFALDCVLTGPLKHSAASIYLTGRHWPFQAYRTTPRNLSSPFSTTTNSIL